MSALNPSTVSMAEATRQQAERAIVAARKHLGTGIMDSSARLCLADAVAMFDDCEMDDAYARAMKSLAYSVGILHPDYRKLA